MALGDNTGNNHAVIPPASYHVTKVEKIRFLLMLVSYLPDICKHLDSKLGQMAADDNQYDTHVAV